jgi:predicted CXXCH cytochrome family protein
MNLVRSVAIAVLSLSPLAAFASGGHDAVGCSGCHSLHSAKGNVIFAIAPNKTYLNPKTKQPYTGTTALCLACHQDADKGGQGFAPVSQHISHPFGLDKVNTRIARVPPELLKDGRFECMGCHDPHPSNPYYKYLRIDTAGGKNIDKFCAACHSSKADPSAAEKLAIFSSSDENAARVQAAAPAPAKAPAKADESKKKK